MRSRVLLLRVTSYTSCLRPCSSVNYGRVMIFLVSTPVSTSRSFLAAVSLKIEISNSVHIQKIEIFYYYKLSLLSF